MADSRKSESKRPDLEDTTNVAEAHASLIAESAAQARENRIKETGIEPVSLWIFLASAVVLLVGGAVLGAGGKLFDYNPMPQGYTRAAFGASGPKQAATGPILDAMMKRGKNLYAKCSGCHGSTGEGDGQNFPPLAGSEWVTGNTERLSMIILNGLTGKIVVKGKTYGAANNMPSQAPLSATELAALMTFVRNSFGNSTGDVVTSEQAAAALEVVKGRAPGQVTVQDLENHDKMLDGDPIDPATVVDFETLEPVEAGEAE